MDYCDNFHAREENDYDITNENELSLNNLQKLDKGFNIIWRQINRKDGFKKKVKINIYTSNGIGSQIRDAETGVYYKYKVGSLDEDLFFKVILSTGECKSTNGSSTLFFLSPKHYVSHMGKDLDLSYFNKFELKRQARLKKLENYNDIRSKQLADIIVH